MVDRECFFLAGTKIKMCNKPVDDYPQALEFVPDCFKTQKMCNKTVGVYFSAIQLFLEAIRL